MSLSLQITPLKEQIREVIREEINSYLASSHYDRLCTLNNYCPFFKKIMSKNWSLVFLKSAPRNRLGNY